MPTTPGTAAHALFTLALFLPMTLALIGLVYVIIEVIRLGSPRKKPPC